MLMVDSSWGRVDRRGLWGGRLTDSACAVAHPMTTSRSEPSSESRPVPHTGRIWALGGEGITGVQADEFPGVQAQYEVSRLQVRGDGFVGYYGKAL